MRNRKLIGVWSLLLAVVACSENYVTAPEPQDEVLRAQLDSVQVFVNSTAAATDSRPARKLDFELLGLDGFKIILSSRSCASPTNTVKLLAPLLQTLTTTACQEPVGRTWDFLKPNRIGTTVTLEYITGVARPNNAWGMYLFGEYPNWQIGFEDGFDYDKNDFFFTLTAIPDTCQLFANPGAVPDPALLDPVVQKHIKDLWIRSDPNRPGGGLEHGGYIVQSLSQPGYEIVEFVGNTNPVICRVTVQSPTELEAVTQVFANFHTHPVFPGTPMPADGSCLGNTDPTRLYGEGPSDPDIEIARTMNHPSYTLDRERIYRMKEQFNRNTDRPEPFERNPNCPLL